MFDIAVNKPPQVVTTVCGPFTRSEVSGKSVDDFDVVVCGGTLGIFIATALCAKGLTVGIVERNILQGVSTKILINLLVFWNELSLLDFIIYWCIVLVIRGNRNGTFQGKSCWNLWKLAFWMKMPLNKL